MTDYVENAIRAAMSTDQKARALQSIIDYRGNLERLNSAMSGNPNLNVLSEWRESGKRISPSHTNLILLV